MTTVALTPFNGATRKGVEHIQTTIKEAAGKSRAVIEEVVKANGETIAEIVHPSESGFQADWETNSDRRERWRKSDREDVIGAGVGLAAATGLFTVLSAVGFHDTTTPDPFALGLAFAIGALGVATVGGYKYAKFVARYLGERSRGHTTRFTEWNRFRIHQTWAMTDEALYVANRDEKSDTLTVTRLAYADIQACAFRKQDGYVGTSVYDKEGNCFYIIYPSSERITSASRLAELVNARIPR